MFGISFAEFLVIAVIAMVVIPAKNWPEVFRALAKMVRFVRQLIWKITDATETIKEQVERELPIDDIVKKTTDEITSAFVSPKRTRNQQPGTRRRKQ
jgi:Sec-independent protein translocase protein TatA